MTNCMNNCSHCVTSSRCPSVPLACTICPQRRCMQAVECNIKWSRCDCRKLKGWLDKNRRLIWALRWHLGCSPEFVQYFLLKLLFSNFGTLLQMNGPEGRSYYLPLTGGCDRYQRNIFDPWGNLKDPLRPSNLISVLNAMRDYILKSAMQLSDKAIEKHGLVKLLGPYDPLVQLVQRLNADVEVPLDLDALLKILLRLDMDELVQTLPKPQKCCIFQDINELYFRVAMPPTMRKCCNLSDWDTDSFSILTERYDGSRYSNTSELLRFRDLLEELFKDKTKPAKATRKRKKSYVPYFWHAFYPSTFRGINEIDLPGRRRLRQTKLDIKKTKETKKYLGYGYLSSDQLDDVLGKVGASKIS